MLRSLQGIIVEAFWYKISSHMLAETIHLWCWSCSTYIKGLCIKAMLFCILMFNNLLIMTDRFTELTCSGVVSDLFQNNSGNSENLAATVFLLITEKCLLGLIAFPLRFFTREETSPCSVLKQQECGHPNSHWRNTEKGLLVNFHQPLLL